MVKKIEEMVKKRLKEGWINTVMAIEVLAVTEEAAKSALEKHVAKMEKEEKVLVAKKQFGEMKKVEKPRRNIEVAYSHFVELEVLAENLDKLVYLAMTYAPSSIEIISPEKITIDMGEAQGILNSVADMLHKFTAAGVGGVVISA